MIMKLNYKRTICVGFAFFLIMAFWQAYDTTVPLILTNKFGMSQTWSGLIMALDNILALFMLPLFGALSDRTKSKMGRRTPYILFGTIVAVVAFVALSFVDGMQLRKISEVSTVDDPAALAVVYDAEADYELLTPDGAPYKLGEVYTKEQFTAIRSTVTKADGKTGTNHDYTNYVVPARQAYIRQKTSAAPSVLILFIALLLVALISMSTFRSPAVALMPDVTIKPLRSKANAVINLMGTAGGILVLVLGIVFKTSAVKNAMMGYTGFFCMIAGIMIAALIVFMLTVREVPFVREMREESRRFGIEEDAPEETPGAETAEGSAQAGTTETAGGAAPKKKGLGAAERRSLLFILASIVLWFTGYNAVTSKYSVYATTILHKDYNLTLMIAQGAAIISYLPVGIIASRVGRKKTIMAGVAMLTVAFGAAALMRAESPTMLMNLMFALAGFAWATINVNSFPMVVEMCSGADIGRYTGYYYTASMAAQVMTPIVSGFLMDRMGMTVLFPYAVIFVACALITMRFVMHGDSKPEAKRGLAALEDMDND